MVRVQAYQFYTNEQRKTNDGWMKTNQFDNEKKKAMRFYSELTEIHSMHITNLASYSTQLNPQCINPCYMMNCIDFNIRGFVLRFQQRDQLTTDIRFTT